MIKQTLLVLCIFSSFGKTPEHVKEVDRLISLFNTEITKETTFVVLGMGSYSESDHLKIPYVDYALIDNPNLNASRHLIVSTAERFLNYLNNRGICRYTDSLLTPRDISISISFFNKDNTPSEPISQVYLINGHIRYDKYSISKKDHLLYHQEDWNH